MREPGHRPPPSIARTLDQEILLVREAIAMVAFGGSPRVIVGGLRFGQELLGPNRAVAAEVGVRLIPLWMPEDAGADIVVERIGDG
jgi:hypothetical protein